MFSIKLVCIIKFKRIIKPSKAQTNKFNMEHLYNALYSLTLLEMERELTEEEKYFYMYAYDILNENNFEIDFAVVF